MQGPENIYVAQILRDDDGDLDIDIRFRTKVPLEEFEKYRQRQEKLLNSLAAKKFTNIPFTVTFSEPISLSEYERFERTYDFAPNGIVKFVARESDGSVGNGYFKNSQVGLAELGRIIQENRLDEVNVIAYSGSIVGSVDGLRRLADEDSVALVDVSAMELSSQIVKKFGRNVTTRIPEIYWQIR